MIQLRLEISPESVIDYGSLPFSGLKGDAYKFKTSGAAYAWLHRKAGRKEQPTTPIWWMHNRDWHENPNPLVSHCVPYQMGSWSQAISKMFKRWITTWTRACPRLQLPLIRKWHTTYGRRHVEQPACISFLTCWIFDIELYIYYMYIQIHTKYITYNYHNLRWWAKKWLAKEYVEGPKRRYED